MGLVVLIILLIVFSGLGAPVMPYYRDNPSVYGWWGSGGLMSLVVLLVILRLLGVI